ncbi:site-specific tyrosine recombinase XerD [Haloimpatiens sp. FM7315]|uniref:site-specific tyrosine recombinase XerD n=1 Tax=Haloimpatiens sp. FM7315 TaxID=3298609 RepID=UPI003977774C
MKDRFLVEYMEKMKNEMLSKNTIESYLRDIERFLEFLNCKKISLFSSNIDTIMAYVQELNERSMANSSIVRNVISVRGFFKYLVERGFMEEDPTYNFDIPKVKRDFPEILTVEEVDKLLNTPDLDTKKGLRDKAMLEVMYATGMRVTELISLEVFDLNLKLAYIRCIGPKKRERLIPIGTYAIRCLENYLNIRQEVNKNNLNYLFVNNHGNRLSRQGFWKIIKTYTKEAGIEKNINAYTLRHSFAVHLLQNGADIRMVQELLGHTSVLATQIYSGVCKKSKIVDMYKKTHPRA